MTTGHILPGYGDSVTRLKRVRSVGCSALDSSTLQELEKATRISQEELSQIRQKARELWSKQLPKATTYETFFSGGEIKERTQARPTSSHRHHNPHPTQLFMTNKLHFISGFHQPDTTVGHSAYKIDDSVDSETQKQRKAIHEKYKSRPDATLISQYQDLNGFKKCLPPREAQAAEAWIKLADDDKKSDVMEILKKQSDWTKQQSSGCENLTKDVYPSMYRWMKMSGVEEITVMPFVDWEELNEDLIVWRAALHSGIKAS